MSSRAQVLSDGDIEIQTDEGDRLILTTDEARTFHAEIECALFSVISDDQIPLIVNDVSLSMVDAELLSARLETLISRIDRETEQRIDWLRLGY